MTKEQEILEKAAHQAAGWMYAEACTSLDNNEDIRTKEVPALMARMRRDLALHPEPLLFQEPQANVSN